MALLLVEGIQSWRLLRRLAQEEPGQDVLEYLLILGAFSVAIVMVLFFGFQGIVPEVLKSLCPSVDPLGGGSECVIE